jgi:hypothetical protein
MGDSIEASVTQFLRRTLAGGAVLVQELEGIERRAWLAIANTSRTQPCVSRVCRCWGDCYLMAQTSRTCFGVRRR